jgi:hypothetical protein
MNFLNEKAIFMNILSFIYPLDPLVNFSSKTLKENISKFKSFKNLICTPLIISPNDCRSLKVEMFHFWSQKDFTNWLDDEKNKIAPKKSQFEYQGLDDCFMYFFFQREVLI